MRELNCLPVCTPLSEIHLAFYLIFSKVLNSAAIMINIYDIYEQQIIKFALFSI